MKSDEIRRAFLDYFRKNGHSVIASSPVIPHGDPTLLFINAGMNQFKDLFLGKALRDYKRASTSQKCIRVGGKHNDLENVGHTARHLTFFEMLGNFSFGDYFKEEAIRFAWEVSTEVFGFQPERIWPSVFREDDEAFELWRKYVPEGRISRFDEKDNFWEMGNTGPCGPCSELYYDRGEQLSSAVGPFYDPEGRRFLEYWNLVFMQYNRVEDGTLQPLPKPSVDTGAGLERIASLSMGVESVYQTDLLRSLIAKVEEVSRVKYDFTDSDRAPAFHVIADHLRCLSFAIADGVQPSNVDRGYVLRKVLRRAVRYGRSLGIEKPFLREVLPALIDAMGGHYPELTQAVGRIEEILTGEEEAFFRTLRRGGNILNQIIDHAKGHGRRISGDEAFKLKDTYGLPFEEVLLLAKDAELTVDSERYNLLEEEAKERSRRAHKETRQLVEESLFQRFIESHPPCRFTGYGTREEEAMVAAIAVGNQFVDEIGEGEEGLLLLDRSPFYAEMGGQVGDSGVIGHSSATFAVEDTRAPYKGVIAHIGRVVTGKIAVGEGVRATVDAARRERIESNHTATHLLHYALQRVLGDHVKQAGSVVDGERLRFDFSHHKALSKSEIEEIEALVNEKIRGNLPVASYELSYDAVQGRGDIKQFFGDKYGSTVRVIDIDYSKELCGGTHTSRVGNIGLFRIAKESSIAAGVRRIEALTGAFAEAFCRESEALVCEMAELLKVAPQKALERLSKVLEENSELARQLKEERRKSAEAVSQQLLSKVERVGEISLLAQEVDVDAKELRSFADLLKERMGSGVVVLAAVSGEDKCNLVAVVSDDLIDRGVKAIDIIRKIAPIVKGGGGGRADGAQAGGKEPGKIGEAFASLRNILQPTHS